MLSHREKQIEVINKIEQQVRNNVLNFSTVSPVDDFENDSRLCLTSVHLPSLSLLKEIKEHIIMPLRQLAPEYYFYSDESLHMTIKNIKVINDPPHFTKVDIKIAQQIFNEVLLRHTKFNVYFYRLLLFKNNLALIGTTDQELDSIILDLDEKLKKGGVPDDKKYTNSQYFFSNMTLARFPSLTPEFKSKVEELSSSIKFKPYTVDSVTLITGNAVLKKRNIIQTWQLK